MFILQLAIQFRIGNTKSSTGNPRVRLGNIQFRICKKRNKQWWESGNTKSRIVNIHKIQHWESESKAWHFFNLELQILKLALGSECKS